jgi:hypothetical protein
MALAAYLVLLFYAHVHIALELHEHGAESAHTEQHEHDPDHDHSPHSADDHQLADSTAGLAKTEQLLIYDLGTVAELVLAPIEESSPVVGWIEDRPKHPPPRLPEQPRSPPFV